MSEEIKELIEKDTPKKPIWEGGCFFRCPSCDKQFITGFTSPMENIYCSKCGQKFDWRKL